jgi:apolipoprotein N-acyltransferase
MFPSPSLPIQRFTSLLNRLSRHSLWLAFGSGMLMGLTPAPVNAWFLAWIALAPLWVIAVSAPRPKTAQPLLAALVWGIGYHGLALSWIHDLHPLTWMGVPWIASVAITSFCWSFITLWGAALVLVWVGLMRWLNQPRGQPQSSLPIGLRVLIGTALWCGLEAFWSLGNLNWTSLSYTQSPANLAILHLGQLSGPFTVTAVIVSCNGLLAEAWMQMQRGLSAAKLLVSSLALLLSAHLIGNILYSQPLLNSSDAGLKLGIVQGNVPTRIKLFEQGVQLSLQNYVQGYESLVAEGVDAVLTPEGAFPWLWINQPQDNLLYQAILAKRVPVWLGTVGLRQARITQTLFNIGGNGEIVGRYDKVKLVPLGEYIPFESVLGKLISRLSPVEATMLPGSPTQMMETPFGQAITGICYDSAFANLFRRQAAAGGQFILTASNNDPYGRAMMAQHHAQDTMRAIETDRWAVRATNTGLSGIVDPHGRTQWLSGFRAYQTHAHNIYRRQTQTVYVRWGNWLTLLLLSLSGAGWLYWRRQ